MFISNDVFKVINAFGYEKYFRINSDKTLSIVGYGVIPMMDIKQYNSATKNAHFYEEYLFDQK